MPAVLVVDDMPIFREPIEAVLRAEGFDVVTASNGQEAIGALSAHKPALVLLDLGMPGMSGLAVLRYMRQNKGHETTPVIILSAEADRGRIVEAVKLGIAGYVLKASFSLKDLLTRIKAQLQPQIAPQASAQAQPLATTGSQPAATEPAPASPPVSAGTHQPQRMAPAGPPATELGSLKPVLTRSELLERLKACEELKGFSPTVSQVLKLTESSNYSLDAVTQAVRQDQAMALKILKIANSSAFSRGDRVDTVHKAILRIGMEGIRQTILNIGVVERFGSHAFTQHLSTPQFWEHSIGCGIIAAEIAQATDPKHSDSAFTCGLLHDLGRVIFAEALGETYSQVIEMARKLEAPLELVETRMLLLNHADVMDRLLSSWKFPKHMIDPIMFHHMPPGSVRTAAPTRSAEILRLSLANSLAHALLIGSSGNETIYPTEEHCRTLGITGTTICAIEETARQQTDDTKFALLSTTRDCAWPQRAEQVRAWLQCPLRHVYISADPDIDAYRIVCAVLAGSVSDEPPNLAVVHLTSVKDQGILSERLLKAEHDARVKNLPVLLLSPTGQLTLEAATIAQRKCQWLSTPTPLRKLTTAMNSLLVGGALQSAA